MVFQERKTESGYVYDVEDLFGTIHIESLEKLTADTLDGVVVLLLGQEITAGEITGRVKHGENILSYKFNKRPQWEEDEEKDTCTPTHTSTKEPERDTTLNPLSAFLKKTESILNWCKKFVAAFQEAWRKTNN